MPTIKDVAKLAGVSVATVSRVLNKNTPVSDHTRDSVDRAVAELDYRPNLLGRNLRRTETRMILVLVPAISNPFYAWVVKGIENAAMENGYSIMLCNTDGDPGREWTYLELLNNRLAEGVIFMAPQIGEKDILEISERFPVVQCCEYKKGADVSYVSIDNFSAAYDAVSYLAGLGHEKIGLITCRNTLVSTEQRELGYLKALEDNGIMFSNKCVKYGNYSYKSGLTAAGQLLASDWKPTAFFSISDIMAIGAIYAAKKSGIRVPDDLSVVGFDDISLASIYDPSLTTVSQPKYDLGYTAMELLLRKFRKEDSGFERRILKHKLMIRESTGVKK